METETGFQGIRVGKYATSSINQSINQSIYSVYVTNNTKKTHNMGTYTGVTYTKIPTKPSVVALQFSTSDLIIYINIILGVVKMWDLREYNTLCLQPSDDTTTMTTARVMASSDDINWQQLIHIIRTHTYIHTYIHV